MRAGSQIEARSWPRSARSATTSRCPTEDDRGRLAPIDEARPTPSVEPEPSDRIGADAPATSCPWHLPADEQLRDGLAVVDKDGRLDVATTWSAKARGILHNKKIGHSGTLDPDATGVLLLGVGRVTRLLRFLTVLPKTYDGRDRARHRDRHARRLGRGHGHPRHGRRSPSTQVRAAAAGADRADHAGAADGVGGQGRRQAAARAGPRGHRGRAGAPAGHGPPLRRRAGRPAHPASTGSRSSARRAPTSARWPPTSATPSAGERTCGTCGAPPSARSRWPRPARSTTCSCVPLDRGTARLPVGGGDRRGRGWPSGFGKVLAGRRSASAPAATGPWAVLDDAGDLLAVYEAHKGRHRQAGGRRRPAPPGPASPRAPAPG